MIKAIIGTAGHVDHGKTALLKALTGIDCDRLPQEKEREITIDLGFAYLKTEEFQIGFIDVPGHERFLKNLLAGLSGFQYFLFCIGLDEGIKPQTIEHLQILKTLGLKKGIVVLTKMDLVDMETVEKRNLEVFQFLEENGFKNIKILSVSSTKGTNILNLKEEIFNLIKENPPEANLNFPSIYPIDRVFILSGKGLVVTGTLLRGKIKLYDELIINPLSKKVRVRGIEVHKEKKEFSSAVERVGLQISGIEKENLRRGLILSEIDLPLTKIITIKPNLIKEIKENTRLKIAHHTREIYGRYHKINENLAQIFLEESVNALKGDKIVLRRFSPPEFFGSAEILDIYMEKIKRGEVINFGNSLKNSLELWIKKSEACGIKKEQVWQRSGYCEIDLFEKMLKELQIVEHQKHLWHKEEYEKLKKNILKNIEVFKNDNPSSYSMPLKSAFSILKNDHEDSLLLKIAKDLNLKIEKGNIVLKEKDILSQEFQDILKLWKNYGLQPPSLEIASNDLKIEINLLKKILRELIQRGFLVQVSVGYYVEKNILDEAIKKLKSTGWEKFTILKFKELFGLTRKYAVPLLEYLDSQRITIRSKDFRILKKG